MDFKTKLAFALVSASLLSMAALGYFTYLWASDMLFEDSQRQLNVLADSKQTEIRGVVDDWVEELQGLVSRVEASGQLETGSDSVVRAELLDVPTAPQDGVAFGGVQVEPDRRLTVVLRAPVAFQAGEIATLEVAFDARPLERFLGRTTKVFETGEASLVTSSAAGYLVIGSSKDTGELERTNALIPEAPAATSAALRGREEILTRVTDRRGTEVMAATRALPELAGGIVVQVDSEEARQRSGVLFGKMRDIGISLAAFAILGGTLIGLYLGRPIHKLVQEVDRIRHGELGLRLEVKGEDEVAFLAQSLNEFMDQLDRSSDLFKLGELDVLVVDRDRTNRELYEGLLQNWNMRPTLVANGEAALSAIGQAGEAGQPLQLALLDEWIPDMDDTHLAEQIRASTSDPFPIILLSSEVESLDEDRLKQAGIGRVLPKPVVASHLMEAILDEMGVSAQSLASTTDVYLKKTPLRKILLAEDSRLIQQVMIGLLSQWGHEVTLAENGRIAVESAERERFDLILMDVEMPEMNGLEATAAIRALEREGKPRTTIVALTAEAMSGDRDRCLSAGMDDYISKPVDARTLYALIERCPATQPTA